MNRYIAPPGVRATIQKSLSAPGGSLIARRHGTELIQDRGITPAEAQRLISYFESRPERGREHELRGGGEGQKWAAELSKALEEESPRGALRKQLSMLLSSHGDDGAPIESFRDHVQRHGHQAVARALRDLGAQHQKGRVTRAKPKAQPKTQAKPEAKAKKTKPKKPKSTVKKALLSRWRPMRIRRSAP